MLSFRAVLLIILAIPAARGGLCGGGARQDDVAYASIGPRSAPLWAAQEQGFFEKNGIEAELIFVRGAPTLVAALTSGDMNIGYTGGTAVLGASVAGIDLKILAVLTNRVTYDLVARPGIKTPGGIARQALWRHQHRRHAMDGGVLGLEQVGIDPRPETISGFW